MHLYLVELEPWSVPGYVDTGSSRQLTDFSIP